MPKLALAPGWHLHLTAWGVGMLEVAVSQTGWSVGMLEVAVSLTGWGVGMLEMAVSLTGWGVGMLEVAVSHDRIGCGVLEMAVTIINWMKTVFLSQNNHLDEDCLFESQQSVG